MSHTDWNQRSTNQARTNKIFEIADRAVAVRRKRGWSLLSCFLSVGKIQDPDSNDSLKHVDAHNFFCLR